jgi:hypothetical protein
MADDESTAGDLGLLAGHGWAERHGHGELAEEARRRVAYGEITDELRELVMNAGGMDDRLALLRSTAWPNDEPACKGSSAACAYSWLRIWTEWPTSIDGA